MPGPHKSKPDRTNSGKLQQHQQLRRDPYEVLGVSRNSTDQEIKSACRKLALKDGSSATYLRNHSVAALATACLVQAIREAQEPRALQVSLYFLYFIAVFHFMLIGCFIWFVLLEIIIIKVVFGTQENEL